MKYVNDWSSIQKRMCAFWNNEIIDRCCISITAPKNGSVNLPKTLPTKTEDKIKYWTDGEWLLKRNKAHFENTCFVGDAFPIIWLNLGAAGHAGYCKNARFQFEETVWFFPIINNLEKESVEFDPNSFLYNKTLELAKYLVNESKGDFIVSMPDNSGNADALAHLRGSEDLLMDMIDSEESVHSALGVLQDILLKTNEEVYNIIKDNNYGGSSIGWLHTWAPGKHSQLQSDISVMLSPNTFNEFIMPELKGQTDWMDYSLYHFDGVEQLRHLDMLLSIERLSAIQWTCVEGQPSALEFIPALRKIQSAGKGLLIKAKPEEVEPLMEQLSSKGLYLVVEASTMDEAEFILKRAEKLTHE